MADEQSAVEQMTVLVVEPGYAPYEKTIPHELHAMQEIVGGLITAIYPYEEGHADEKLDSPRSQRRNYSVRTTEVYERRDAKSR